MCVLCITAQDGMYYLTQNTRHMKEVLLLLTCMFLFACFSFSQTTLEEYNYISKGYKIQLESGLDMKRGYLLEDIDA